MRWRRRMLRRQRRSSTPGAAGAYSARKARAAQNRTATAERRAARRDLDEAEQILAELREAEQARGETYFIDPDGFRFTFERRAPDELTALTRSFAQELARSKLLRAFWPKPLFGRSLLS